MAICSSIVARIIRWTEEPGGLQSMESQRLGHDYVLHAQCTIYRNNISLTQNSAFENFALREKYKTSMQRDVQQEGHHSPMTAPPLKSETV